MKNIIQLLFSLIHLRWCFKPSSQVSEKNTIVADLQKMISSEIVPDKIGDNRR